MNLKQYLKNNPDIKTFCLSSVNFCGDCESNDEDMLELFGDRTVLDVHKGNIIMIYIL